MIQHMFIVDPDPANDMLRFYYYLSQSSLVKLEILSINGRQAALLDHGFQKSGDHILLWSPNLLDDGIYLVRFSVGDECATYNLSVIKQENITQ